MTFSKLPPSDASDETMRQNKTPTKADLMEIRSLYAQADAIAEATDKSSTSSGADSSSDDEDQRTNAAPPPSKSELSDERNEAAEAAGTLTSSY